MRCVACNNILTDSELKARYTDNSFMDTCHPCRAQGHTKFGYYDLFEGRQGDPVGEILTNGMQNYE